MKRRRRLPPSPGFVVLLSGYLLVAVFLAWGFVEPDISRVWTVYHRMDQPGFEGLTDHEVELIASVIERHPELGLERLGERRMRFLEPTDSGWTRLRQAHLLVRPRAAGDDAKPEVELQLSCPDEVLPVTVTLQGHGVDERITFEEVGARAVAIELPEGPAPGLVRVTIDKAIAVGGAADPPYGIRLVARSGEPAEDDEQEGASP